MKKELNQKEVSPKVINWARQCDVTGEGMNEGYCIQDGLMYIKYEKDMLKHIRGLEKEGNLEYDKDVSEGRLTDDFLLNDYYEADYYYWTEWECEDDIQFVEINGEMYDVDISEDIIAELSQKDVVSLSSKREE